MIKLKNILKELTDNDFKGSEVISMVNREQPDLFGKKLFTDILPKGSASEAKAIKHEGQEYRLHQTQYYNSNFEDKDPTFNPKVTKLDLMKINPDTKDSEDVGEMLVKTDEYIQDLKRLKITKKAM